MTSLDPAPVLSPPRPVTPVGILAAKLGAVADGLSVMSGLDPALLAELDRARELAAGLEPYLSRWTTPETPTLREIARRTEAEDWTGHADNQHGLEQEMLSGHVEGQFLKMLVRITGARRVLEIGMFTGYSALAMAEALPADGTVVACEIDERAAAFARGCFDATPNGRKIDIRVGAALDALADLARANESFDLVFVDADKAGYVGYLDALLDGPLLAPHGLLCVDNTLLQGQPYLSGEPTPNGAAIDRFNRAVAADDRVEQVIVPLRDGITLIRRVTDDR